MSNPRRLTEGEHIGGNTIVELKPRLRLSGAAESIGAQVRSPQPLQPHLRAMPLTTPPNDPTLQGRTEVRLDLDAADPRKQFEHSADLLKAVAETQRLQIISLLLSGPQRVGDLAERIGHEMAKVSHHLGVLRQSRLVTATKRGRFVEYALHPDTHVERSGGRAELVIELGLVRFSLPMPQTN